MRTSKLIFICLWRSLALVGVILTWGTWRFAEELLSHDLDTWTSRALRVSNVAPHSARMKPGAGEILVIFVLWGALHGDVVGRRLLARFASRSVVDISFPHAPPVDFFLTFSTGVCFVCASWGEVAYLPGVLLRVACLPVGLHRAADFFTWVKVDVFLRLYERTSWELAEFLYFIRDRFVCLIFSSMPIGLVVCARVSIPTLLAMGR